MPVVAGKGTIFDAETNDAKIIDDKEVKGVNLIKGENLADKIHQYADAMLGNKLVTIQTGEEGSIVNRLLIEEGCSNF